MERDPPAGPLSDATRRGRRGYIARRADVGGADVREGRNLLRPNGVRTQ